MKLRSLLPTLLVVASMFVMSHSAFAKKKDSSTPIEDKPAFGFFYSTESQPIPAGNAVTFHKHRQLLNMEHTLGSPSILIRETGVYNVNWFTSSRYQSVFDLRVNGVTIPGTVTTAPSSVFSPFSAANGNTLVTLYANDVLTVNHASADRESLEEPWNNKLENSSHFSKFELLTARLTAVKIY